MVLGIGRGPRDQRRLRGKDDSLDAVLDSMSAQSMITSQVMAMGCSAAGRWRE
jgi:hypothetical protein